VVVNLRRSLSFAIMPAMAKLDWYIRATSNPALQLLVALDDLRHLGRVATSLHVSQPAVSLALAELEKGLGLKLFERTPRGWCRTATATA